MRIAPNGRVTGWDMTAALALGAAMGIASRAVAELVPVAEAAMARKINEQSKDDAQ